MRRASLIKGGRVMKGPGFARDIRRLAAALQFSDSVIAISRALYDFRLLDDDPVICLGVLDTEANVVRFEYAGPVSSEMRDRYHVATLDTPLVPIDVIKSGKRIVVTDTADLGSRYRHVVQETVDHVGACVSQPLCGTAGGVIGSLGLLWATPRTFKRAELDMFARVARMAQVALERVCALERERRIAVESRTRMLDLDHGSTAAVVAGVYRRADATVTGGGDWCLAIPLEQPDSVAVCVGDVFGDGSAAAATTRLRDAVSASALVDADPAAVLTAVDRCAADLPGARWATVAYAVIEGGSATGAAHDSGTVRIRYSCAGHPFPLLISPGRAPAFLDAGRRPPVSPGERHGGHEPATVTLPAGSMVMLYTDGLIERPGEPVDQGLGRLKSAAAHCVDLPAADSCAELVKRMCPSGGYLNDVVVLAVRPGHAAAGSFVTVLPATLTQLPEARHRLRDWLATAGVDANRHLDILMATGEAVTNAIEHGSNCDPKRTVAIEAFLRGNTVPITVSDTGQWSGDSTASHRAKKRGRGLTLINGLADRVDTIRTAAGSRITLEFDLAAS